MRQECGEALANGGSDQATRLRESTRDHCRASSSDPLNPVTVVVAMAQVVSAPPGALLSSDGLRVAGGMAAQIDCWRGMRKKRHCPAAGVPPPHPPTDIWPTRDMLHVLAGTLFKLTCLTEISSLTTTTHIFVSTHPCADASCR